MFIARNMTKTYRVPGRLGRYTVLRNCSFTLPAGRNIALMGRNGAGKSTLLRLLGGIDRPDKGSLSVPRSISWPLGLSSALHPNMTGRQNIRFICRLYGRWHDREEIVRYVQEFAEVGEHFDQPMRTYSNGMRARVAFGLSMAFEFETYLIDEILSVGDLKFREKANACFDQMLERSSIILVSHNPDTLKRLCNMSAVIVDKKVHIFDSVAEGADFYLKSEEN